MEDSVVLKTRLGPVRGSIIPSYNGFPIYTFQGIPYALPPVGELRFKNPIPIEPWIDELDATKEPPVASQLTVVEKIMFPNCSEDCLYLNVYSPKVGDSNLKLAVLVYIHGGAFQHGCGNRNFYGPDYIVPEGVILVTINYRVGALGFLSFLNEECPGNFGLKDQNLALQWVRDNIADYGGDPDNITICGQSAGGASVHFHVISPKSKGLFKRAIAMSGSTLNFWATVKNPIAKGLLLAKRLGCDTTDPSVAFEAIKQASAEEICRKSEGVEEEVDGEWDAMRALSMAFVPVVEPEGLPGSFLTKSPEQILADGDYADVPIVLGVTADEGALFLTPPTFVPPYKSDEEYRELLPKGKRPIPGALKLKDFYFPDGNTREGFIKLTSASAFTYGIYQATRSHLDHSTKVSPHFLYVFEMTRHPAVVRSLFGTTELPGTAHADELDYLFHPNHFVPGLYERDPVDPNTKDGKAQRLFTKLWTDFAKTGVPSPEWRPADETFPYVRITDVLESRNGFFAEEMKLWAEIYDMLK